MGGTTGCSFYFLWASPAPPWGQTSFSVPEHTSKIQKEGSGNACRSHANGPVTDNFSGTSGAKSQSALNDEAAGCWGGRPGFLPRRFTILFRVSGLSLAVSVPGLEGLCPRWGHDGQRRKGTKGRKYVRNVLQIELQSIEHVYL